MPTNSQADSKQKLRWYQFSLRALLIFVTIFACACSWFAVNMQQARRQREAVAAVKNLDGYIAYYYERGADFLITGNEPHGPRWLQDLLGIDFFNTVSFVFLKGNKINDKDLEALANLKQIVVLVLDGAHITDAALKNIEGMNKLKTLSLDNTPVTDECITDIIALKQLRFLCISGTNITDAGVAELQKALPDCKIVH